MPTSGRPSSSVAVVIASATGRVHSGANRAERVQRAQRRAVPIVAPGDGGGGGGGVVHGLSFGGLVIAGLVAPAQRQNGRGRVERGCGAGRFRCALRSAQRGRRATIA